MAVTVEWETDDQRMETCDHDGTTEPLGGMTSVSVCTACGKTWPARLGAGAADRADHRQEREGRLTGALLRLGLERPALALASVVQADFLALAARALACLRAASLSAAVARFTSAGVAKKPSTAASASCVPIRARSAPEAVARLRC